MAIALPGMSGAVSVAAEDGSLVLKFPNRYNTTGCSAEDIQSVDYETKLSEQDSERGKN